MIVRLPFPDSSLFPNRKNGNHWTKAHAAKVAARDGAFYLTKQAAKDFKPCDGAIPLSVMFCLPDGRHRDLDNMLAACKAQIDGIAQALGVDDKRFRPILLDAMQGTKPGALVVCVGAAITQFMPFHDDLL